GCTPEELDDALRTFPEWVGVLPYEAFRTAERGPRGSGNDARPAPQISSPIWHRYPAVAQVEGEQIIVRGETLQAVEDLVGALRAPLVSTGAASAKMVWAEPPEE